MRPTISITVRLEGLRTERTSAGKSVGDCYTVSANELNYLYNQLCMLLVDITDVHDSAMCNDYTITRSCNLTS